MPFSFDGVFSPGQYASVQCILDGDMPLYITWLFNGGPLSDAMGVTIMKAGKRSSLLTIEHIHEYNAGKYICKGANSAGMAAYATELIVNGGTQKKTFLNIFLSVVHI